MTYRVTVGTRVHTGELTVLAVSEAQTQKVDKIMNGFSSFFSSASINLFF